MGAPRTRNAVWLVAGIAAVLGVGTYLALEPSRGDAPGSGSPPGAGTEGPAGGLASRDRAPDASRERAVAVAYRVGDGARALEGRVLEHATGQAVKGATVAWEATGPEGPGSGRVTTAADGSFTVPVPGSDATLCVTAAGFASVVRAGVVPGRIAEFRLRAAARLVGRVVREGGVPVPGVPVRFTPLPASSLRPSASAVTDAQGAFTFEGLGGSGFVVARGAGWIPRVLADPFGRTAWPNDGRRDVAFAPGQTTEIVLEVATGVEASGRVVAAGGSGVQGAPVWVGAVDGDGERLESDPWGDPEAVSGADGTFVVGSLVPEVTYVFWSRPEGSAVGASSPVARRSGQPLRVEIPVPSPRFLDVTVVKSGTKTPIPGARVTVRDPVSGHLPRRDDREWATGPDGTVRVGPLGPEARDVSARAPGFHQTYASSSPPPTPEGASLILGLARQVRIEGRVVFADGRPAAAARVSVLGAPGPGASGDPHVLSTLADGTFTSRDVHPGPHRLEVETSREGAPFHAESSVEGGGPPVVLTLLPSAGPQPIPSARDPRSVVVRLHVEDPDGRPVPRARVRAGDGQPRLSDGVALLEVPSSGPARIDVSLATDEDGYPLPLGPGRLDLVDAVGGDVTLRLPRGRSLEGRVIGPDGAPVPFLLLLAYEEPPGPGLTEERGLHGTVRTDSGGRFRLESLTDGPYWIEPAAEGPLLPPRPPVRARAADGERVFRLRAGTSAEVTVLDGAAAPVVGARVEVHAPRWSRRNLGLTFVDQVVARATTDGSGVAHLAGLDPEADAMSLEVLPPRDRGGLAKSRTERWQGADARVTLAAVGTIRGRVLDEAGRPVPEAWVLLRRDGRTEARASEGADGRFSWEDLPVGEYDLAAASQRQDAPSPQARVLRATAGGADVTLTLARGDTLDVQVQGVPTTDATEVLLWPETDADPAGARTGWAQEGRLGYRGLVAGVPYALWARSSAGGLTRVEHGLSPRVEPYVVRLERGRSITGRWTIPVAAGAAWVEARASGPARRVAGRIEGDRFVVDGLSEGSWTIVVTAAAWDATSWTGEATVRAGESVDVVLSRAPR